MGLAISASRLAREMPREWLSRIKANPQVEVIQLVATTGVSIVPYVGSVLKSDPLDSRPHYAAVMAVVDELAETELGDKVSCMGACHAFWAVKKRILKNQFGLGWSSPADLNPDVIFD